MTETLEAPAVLPGTFSLGRSFEVRTRAVLDDEPCFYLMEANLPSKSGRSMSRFQVLRIVRDDQLVTAYVYLGPASSFQADQFQMIGGVIEDGRGRAVHTVGELREGAEELRNQTPRREQEPSDLPTAFQNYVEEKKRREEHLSTFGAGVAKVRA